MRPFGSTSRMECIRAQASMAFSSCPIPGLLLRRLLIGWRWRQLDHRCPLLLLHITLGNIRICNIPVLPRAKALDGL